LAAESAPPPETEGSIVVFFSQVIDTEALSEFDCFLDELDALDAEREIFKPKLPLELREQRVAIIHPDLGIYISRSDGISLWSLTAPDWWVPLAVTFSDEVNARAFVASWPERSSTGSYRYVRVPVCDEEYCEELAGPEELAYAGLESLFGRVFEIEVTSRAL
jgi:hypothetical protein